MENLRYPIGLQTFSKIIREGYAYVDKTRFIAPLIEQGQFIFLSRPRRFGKSLLLSTIHAYFEGRRELFKGLAADSMGLDWIPSPVLHFDFNAEDYGREEGLEHILDGYLRDYEERYGRRSEDVTVAQRFRYIIRKAYEQTGREVVILVDEYDKPLLEAEENPELVEKNQRLLKSFYGNLKTMDRYIRFAMITGVARFSKVSIFSDFNNLDDISMEETFAGLCGWTEEELIENFRKGIEELAASREEDFDTTLNAIRNYYDGYLFTPRGCRLYNPYSVLRALKTKDISSYWFGTGTPTFLVRRFRRLGIYPPDVERVMCEKEELTTVGLDDSNPIPLMFQTGYLTIGSYDREMEMFELRFPNREVETGFYRDLLKVYVPMTETLRSPFNFKEFKRDLHSGRPEEFMHRLAVLLKDLPGEDHCESAYRAITYLLAVLSGTLAVAEHHGYLGRSDIEVQTGKYIYLFEFKYNRTVKEAFEQIESRDYAGRYALDPRPVFLIGANFDEKREDRGLKFEVRVWQKP